MNQEIVYIVVKRDFQYDDCHYAFTGGENVVKAYRSREKAEAKAQELSRDTFLSSYLDRLSAYDGLADPYVVMEAVVAVSENSIQKEETDG